MKAENRKEVIKRAEGLLAQVSLSELYDHEDITQYLQEHPAPDFLKGMMLGIALIEHGAGFNTK